MYQFQNADICPQAREVFNDYPTLNVQETIELIKAARHIDHALGILKRGYALGSLQEHEYDEFLTQIEDAEDILESLGIHEDHDYIREDLEPRATELLSVDSVDIEDEANELENEDRWLFPDDVDDE